MNINQEIVDELNLLLRFSRSSALDSLEIRADGDPAVVSAAQRLFHKRIITRSDGGNLTENGLQAVEYVEQLGNLLAPDLEPI
ncbi:MAG: hypothetical protein ACI9KN_001663 [Gammaproteobacteria bacterium]|jgi:uncharacterized protein (TIGR02647 family)